MPATLSCAAGPGNIQQPIQAAYRHGFRTQEAATAAFSSHMQQAGGLSVCQHQCHRRDVAQTGAGTSRHQPPRSHTGSQARPGTDRRLAALQLQMRLMARPSAPRSAGGARVAAKRPLRLQQRSRGQRLMRRRVHHRHRLSVLHLSRPSLQLVIAACFHHVTAHLKYSCTVCRHQIRRRMISL